MSSNAWPLQEAKNKLSEVVRRAVTEGPQSITVRGRATAVVLSTEEYARLATRPGSLVAFLRSSPLAGVELDIERSLDPGRPVRL